MMEKDIESGFGWHINLVRRFLIPLAVLLDVRRCSVIRYVCLDWPHYESRA